MKNDEHWYGSTHHDSQLKYMQHSGYIWDKLYSWNRLVQKSGKSRWLWNSFSIWNSSSISMSSALTKSQQEKLTSNKITAISNLYNSFCCHLSLLFLRLWSEFCQDGSGILQECKSEFWAEIYYSIHNNIFFNFRSIHRMAPFTFLMVEKNKLSNKAMKS